MSDARAGLPARPALLALTGAPGVGKTTLARALARRWGAVHVRVDSIEVALRAAGDDGPMDDRGYRVAYAVALDNLRSGLRVVADSVNPIPETREAWRAVSRRAGAAHLDVAVVCSDPAAHRRRVEGRIPDLDGQRLPTWDEVLARGIAPWDPEALVIDLARLSVDDALARIAERVGP